MGCALTDRREAAFAVGGHVSPSLLGMLGARPSIGADSRPADEGPVCPLVNHQSFRSGPRVIGAESRDRRRHE